MAYFKMDFKVIKIECIYNKSEYSENMTQKLKYVQVSNLCNVKNK